MKTSRFAAIAASLAALALAACQERGSGTAPSAAEPTTPAPAPTDIAVVEPKSIIRPTVIEEQATSPAIERKSVIVPFAERSDSLSEAARARLDDLLAAPAVQAGGEITLRGHSDSRGHDGDNLVASRRRAEAVRDYLEGKGVARDRMTIVALGEARPIAPNAHEDGSDNPEGRATNRRVEVVVEPPVTAGDSATTPDSEP